MLSPAGIIGDGARDGKRPSLILTACFVCDLGTVGALGILFANYRGFAIRLAGGIMRAVQGAGGPWARKLGVSR